MHSDFIVLSDESKYFWKKSGTGVTQAPYVIIFVMGNFVLLKCLSKHSKEQNGQNWFSNPPSIQYQMEATCKNKEPMVA